MSLSRYDHEVICHGRKRAADGGATNSPGAKPIRFARAGRLGRDRDPSEDLYAVLQPEEVTCDRRGS
jgi:hypothetical protein